MRRVTPLFGNAAIRRIFAATRGALTGLMLVALPACRAVPDALTSLLPGESTGIAVASDSEEPVAQAAYQPPVPQPLSPPIAQPPQAQILGLPPARPIIGETLPTVPRDGAGACVPPIPFIVNGPWAPPGLKHPFPYDEYLHDGGDAQRPVAVSPEWRVEGLNVEDTVAHYDTLDGRTLVEASNCAYVYAPRFSAVRVVTNATSGEMIDAPIGVRKPEQVVRIDDRARVGTKTEHLQPVGRTGNFKPTQYRGDQRDGGQSYALVPVNSQQETPPVEGVTRWGNQILQGNEKARLAETSENAIVWTKDVGVQVFIGDQKTTVLTGDRRAQAIFIVKEPTNAKLRICKVASTPAAQPGDTVDFIIRYDNVGDAVIGNVVILDSLTTRLEYVADSAQSSRRASFTTADNVADSLELRWEIDEPLKPGQGGVVRFRCRVR